MIESDEVTAYLSCVQNSDNELSSSVIAEFYKKYSFRAPTINIWNSLPNNIVDAESVNILKTCLDKYWSHQPLLYDFKTEIAGTGDRPNCDIEI